MKFIKRLKHWYLVYHIKKVMRWEQKHKIMGSLKEYKARNKMIDDAIRKVRHEKK